MAAEIAAEIAIEAVVYPGSWAPESATMRRAVNHIC
jgi:hypothetical protein